MRFGRYLKEARQPKLKTVVASFGRFNPPSIGHKKLIERVATVAKGYGADWSIFLSHSHDPKKNPLKPKRKLHWLHQMFPSYRRNIQLSSTVKTFIDLAKFYDGKYDRLVVVAGDDRLSDYKRILDTYNGRDYNYEDVQVVSAGARDPNATGVEGMSASKLRKFVQSGDFESFSMGVPLKERQAQELYDELRQAMGVA